ncbi:AraC family transcriptional regulator [Streptomyces swartbergensis]|uniref:AraC family transcriptional regulator n=2 Tax=Streptomyces swartbergensis TaxID=487165 RepID=A0A243SAT6_9ACTN|nr:AraC family transcriptional regulator [Streptomyces swartbergensis]
MVDRRHPQRSGRPSSTVSSSRPLFIAGAEPASVPLYGFQPPVGTPYGLEVTTVEDFHAHHDDWPWNPPRPGRATFHYLILVTEGVLRHDVDHVTRTVAPGQWLWVRPGHAQCWHDPSTARGPFVLFEPDVLRPDTARELAPLTSHDAPAVLTPHSDDAPWLEQTALQLLDEHRALGRRPLAAHHALRRSLLEALLLRLAHSPGVSDPPADAGTASSGSSPRSAPHGDTAARHHTYERFLDALELHFRELHRVDDYAQLLGCSVRTLSRAAQAAIGKGAREVINERRLLEARRLLGHSRWTAHAVAAHLGFTDAANFGRFFRHHTGLTPAAYAARQATPER